MSETLRVILWDIDGTLVRSRRDGFFKDYMAPVMVRVFGTAGRLDELSASGMTDLQIVAEALRDEGFTAEQVRERAAELGPLYLEGLERLTGAEEIFYALDGAREALEALERSPRYLNSLLTGNVLPAARLKLSLVGLWDFFRLPGAFGEDSHDRRCDQSSSSSSATPPTTSPARDTSARAPSPSPPAAATTPRNSPRTRPTPSSETSPTPDSSSTPSPNSEPSAGRPLTFPAAWDTTPLLTNTHILPVTDTEPSGHSPAKSGPFYLRPAPPARLFREDAHHVYRTHYGNQLHFAEEF
jgi:hypothetical protein